MSCPIDRPIGHLEALNEELEYKIIGKGGDYIALGLLSERERTEIVNKAAIRRQYRDVMHCTKDT